MKIANLIALAAILSMNASAAMENLPKDFQVPDVLELAEKLQKTNPVEMQAMCSSFTPSPALNADSTSRDYIFDVGVKAALRGAYNDSSDANAARQKVSNVLSRHHCNGDIVSGIEFRQWGVSKVGGPADLESMQENFSSELLLNQAGKLGHPSAFGGDPYSKLLEGSRAGKKFSYSEKANLNSSWATLGYTGNCAKIMGATRAVCSGEITPAKAFRKYSSLDPETAKAADGDGEDLPSLSSVIKKGIEYGAQGKVDKAGDVVDDANAEEVGKQIADVKKANDQLNTEIKNKEDRVQAIDDDLSGKDLPGPVNPKDNNSISPDVYKQTPEELAAERNTLKNDIIANQAAIKKNNETLEKLERKQNDLNSSNPGEPIKDPKNPLNKWRNEEMAFENFLQGQWATFIRGLSQYSKQCRGDLSSPVAELMPEMESISRNGETCDYQGALKELDAVANPPYDPRLPEKEAGKTERKFWEAIRSQDFPSCDSSNGADCDAVYNRYFKSKGYGGGLDEFCTLAAGPIGPCASREFSKIQSEMEEKVKASKGNSYQLAGPKLFPIEKPKYKAEIPPARACKKDPLGKECWKNFKLKVNN